MQGRRQSECGLNKSKVSHNVHIVRFDLKLIIIVCTQPAQSLSIIIRDV